MLMIPWFPPQAELHPPPTEALESRETIDLWVWQYPRVGLGDLQGEPPAEVVQDPDPRAPPRVASLWDVWDVWDVLVVRVVSELATAWE